MKIDRARHGNQARIWSRNCSIADPIEVPPVGLPVVSTLGECPVAL